MKNAKVCWTLLISHIVYVLFGIGWLFIALFSVMMFDSPGSENHAGIWTLFVTIWSYPIFLAAAIIGGWVFYHMRKFRAALWMDAFPLLWAVLTGILFAVVMD